MSSSASRSRSPPREERKRSRSPRDERRRRDRSDSRSPPRRRRSPSRDSRSPQQRQRRAPSRERERAPARPQAPPVDSIHEARVLTIKPFGAFAEIDGFVSHGLVHISQLAPRRVETVEEVVNVGDTVKVKVISVEMGENGRSKVSLSMKQVDQATGQDLGDVGGGGGGGGGRREHKKREEGEDLTQFQFGTGQQLSALEHDDDDVDAAPDAPKIKPNYEATGKLAESVNKINGVNMKYGEPPDATKPTKHWRLYVFKGKEAIDPYHIHRQSMYLLGRERRVADIPLDHPSCSSQHCVLQFRMTQKTETNEQGQRRESKLVRPYLIDLGSTNGCYVNGDRIEAQRYVELLEKDCLRFGYSSREYVLLNADKDNQ